MFYSINWPDFIVLLPLLIEILDNKCIVIICCPVFNVINCENNQNFLIKSFFYAIEKSRQKCKYLKNEKSFWHEKAFFTIFKEPSLN